MKNLSLWHATCFRNIRIWKTRHLYQNHKNVILLIGHHGLLYQEPVTIAQAFIFLIFCLRFFFFVNLLSNEYLSFVIKHIMAFSYTASIFGLVVWYYIYAHTQIYTHPLHWTQQSAIKIRICCKFRNFIKCFLSEPV